MSGIGDVRDPARETYEAPCPDCGGRGVLETQDARGFAHDECHRCDGEGLATVDAGEVVTVTCSRCDGEGSVEVGWDLQEETCDHCKGDGELTGHAEQVCS